MGRPGTDRFRTFLSELFTNWSVSYNVSYPDYQGANYDASTTNLTYLIPGPGIAAPLEIIVSFLSPITPTSTLRQSIPASYVTVIASGTVDVNIYIELNGQWVSGDRGSQIVWNLDNVILEDENRALKKWQVTRQTELLLSEIADRAEWGTLHFTGPEVGLLVENLAGIDSLLEQKS
jgi:hypothetical protein